MTIDDFYIYLFIYKFVCVLSRLFKQILTFLNVRIVDGLLLLLLTLSMLILFMLLVLSLVVVLMLSRSIISLPISSRPAMFRPTRRNSGNIYEIRFIVVNFGNRIFLEKHLRNFVFVFCIFYHTSNFFNCDTKNLHKIRRK